MPKFSMKPEQARRAAEEERKIADQLSRCMEDLKSVKSEIRSDINGFAGIRRALDSVSTQVSRYQGTVSSCQSALHNVVALYENSESKITGISVGSIGAAGFFSYANVPPENTEVLTIDGLTLHNIINAISKYDIGDVINEIQKIKNLNPGEALTEWLRSNGIDVASVPIISGIVTGLSSWKDVKNFLADVPGTVKSEAQKYVVDKTSFHEGVDGKGSLYSTGVSGEYGSVSLDVGAYEYYADAEGRVFRIDDDGNMVFDPHIAAEIGASYSLITASGNIGVGNEYLGANAEGEITVGRVSGTAKAEAGLYDENGHFNPNASVNANLEAVAVEAKGEAGVNVVGVEGKVTGSAYVGIGAHANVEISGGKVSVDIGAALGVGVSVGFELDFSGMINCVQDTCSSVFENLWPW